MIVEYSIIGGIGLLIIWTTTVVGCLVWLNNRFSELKERIDERLTTEAYEHHHNTLVERIRQLELWRASKSGIT